MGALLCVSPAALAKGADRDEPKAEEPKAEEQKPKGEEQKPKAEQPREDKADEGVKGEDRGEGDHREGEGDEGDGRRYNDGRYYDGRYGDGYYYDEPSDPSHFVARMTADQETKPGPAGGRGLARLDVDPYEHRVCYQLSYEGIGKPTGGHIHRGERGVNGPPVVDFDLARNGDHACVAGNPRVLRDMQAQPQHYYVNLHTAEFPDGAIRGQVDYPTG